MKKIISFDLDGTLVHGKYGDLVWNEGIPREYARKHSISFDTARAMIRKEYEAVGDSDVVWYDIGLWLAKFGLEVDAAELLDRYDDHIELLPHVRDVLDSLARRYTLVVASNAARMFVEKEMEVTGIGAYFSHVVSASTDYGMLKKEGSFFLRLLNVLGASPEEAVHVGDHAVFDYDVPSGLGIESYHVAYPPSPYNSGARERSGERVIQDLRGLLDRL